MRLKTSCALLAFTAALGVSDCRLPEADRIDPTGTTGPSPVPAVDSLSTPFVPALWSDTFTDDSVTLTWSTLPTTTRLCVLERSDDDTLNFHVIASPATVSRSYVDVGLKQIFVPYYYRLQIVYDDGARTSRAVFRLYLDPKRPISVHPLHRSAQCVALQWMFKGNICQAFSITRTQDEGPPAVLATVPAGTRMFTDSTLETRSAYTYRITALTKSQAGPPSLPLTIGYVEDPVSGVTEWRRID